MTMREPVWQPRDREGEIMITVYHTPVTIGRDKNGKVVVDDRRRG